MSFRNYLIVLLATFGLFAGGYWIYSRAVRLSCWPGGYAQNAWMAYCNSNKYGVYDVDAAWFGVEPDVASSVAKAEVLTLSDSHMQNALSLGGASEWFAKNNYRVYFLGFPNGESGYGEMLLDKFKPHPRLVIFDTSPYFTGALGGFESSIVTDAAVRKFQAEELHQFEAYHESFCGRHPALCGHNFAYFRSRLDGHWIFPEPSPQIWLGRRSVPNDRLRYPTEQGPDENIPLYPKYLAAARKVVAKLDLPSHCIVITHVPSEGLNSDLAPFLAKELGATLVDPTFTDLSTFDRSHLTRESSLRWTAAFLEQLDPVLKSCVPGKATLP